VLIARALASEPDLLLVYSPLSGWQPLHRLHGAIVAALLAALVIGVVSMRARQREDTVISALWAIGMAVGVLFVYATSSASSW
jgi:zinc transport system permease protein